MPANHDDGTLPLVKRCAGSPARPCRSTRRLLASMRAMSSETSGHSSVRRAVLVGAFRSMISEGDDGPFGGQGGFADSLGPAPYSLATGYLKAFAEADPEIAARWKIDRLDLVQALELEDDTEHVALEDTHVEQILALEPDVVGFSSYCWNIDAFRDAARALKRRRPAVTILVGGRATDGEPHELLSEVAEIDAAIVGEGELAFREILRRDLDLAGIAGVVHRRGSEIVQHGPAAIVEELDSIPSPFLDGTLSPARHGVMLELGRGCRHACAYCTWNSHKRLRFFSPARIEAEIRHALAQGHRHATLIDSALNYDSAHLRALVDAIHRADPTGEMRFTYNLRHEEVTAEQLELLARLPTHMVLLGVESLSPAAMRASGRTPADAGRLRETLSAVSRAIRPPLASIVLGLPDDDVDGFVSTLETLLSWTEPREGEPPAVGAVLVSLLQVYRGSGLWKRRDELGLQFEPHGIPYLLEGGGFSVRDLARAKAHLVRRMGELPDRLKAAEAIVLMEARGGLDPWLTTKRIQELLAPWLPGSTLQGWTFVRAGILRDSGRSALLRFGWQDGGSVRVRLSVRRSSSPRTAGQGRYELGLEPVGRPAPPTAACRKLEVMVRTILAQGERRWVAATMRARARPG